MTRFLTLDHAYQEAFAQLPHANHDEWFQQCFGTSDFLDVALRAAGHEAKTLVRNFFGTHAEMGEAGREFEPDVVLIREAGRFSGAWCRAQFQNAKLICTCSHAVDDSQLTGFDAVFTSFPWFVDHLKSIGIRGEYLPLAFGRPVLERLGELPKERDIPVCFIGGLGNRIWDQGTKTMAAIAEAVPDLFVWAGYWAGDESQIPPALQRCRRPTVYGADYFRMLTRSRIVVNRHGEIARGQQRQNLREYEAGGMAAFLLSDTTISCAGTAHYASAEEAIDVIPVLLHRRETIERQGREHQEMILRQDCYENRAVRFLEVVASL